jgi:Flp pilus assembly protein TadB
VISAVYRDARIKAMIKSIERYGPREAAESPDGLLSGIAARWVAPLLRFGALESRLAERLDLAGSTRKPAEWVLLGGFAAAVVTTMLAALSGDPVVALGLGVLGSWLAMRLALTLQISRRRRAFSDQLPDVLQFIAGSLHSGFSLAQGVDAVVRESSQPAASELSRALARSRIGVSLDDALDTVADRMDSRDLRWTVIAVRTQREVGGNLAEVLGQTVETMRERATIRRHVRGLSAEGRLSAYVLIALPIIVGGWLFLSSRNYVRPLYTTAPGILMMTVAVLLMAIGSVWMRKLATVEV